MSNKPEDQFSPGSETSGTSQSSRRLSRRSALKKATGIAGVTLAAGVGGMLPTTASHNESNLNTLTSQMVLTDKDALKQRVLASSAMQPLLQRYGTAALAGAPTIHATFHATDLQAVSMVLQHPGQPDRAVWAYFKPQQPDFKVLQFEFAPAKEMLDELGAGERAAIAGRAAFFTASDRALGSAIFRNNTLVATGIPAIGLEVDAGEDWGCFENCLIKLWDQLPGWLQSICAGACGACLIHVLPACPGCFACVAGYAGACFSGCWR